MELKRRFKKGMSMFGFSIFVLTGVFLVFSWNFVLAGETEQGGDTLATIDGKSIKPEDLGAEIKRQGLSAFWQRATPEQREALLNDVVRFEILHSAAVRAGYDKRPDIMESVRRMIAAQYRQEALGPAIANITVDESEINAYYEANISDFVSPRMVRAALIRVTVPAKASAEKKAELYKRASEARQEALALPQSTPSFGSVAVKYSDDQSSRYRGGEVGLLKAGESRDLEKEIVNAVFSLKMPGEISMVVEAPSGYYIVRLMEIKESFPKPLEEVRELIGYRIMNDKKDKIEREFFEALSALVPVTVNKSLLEKVEVPGTAQSDKPPALPRR